MPWYVPTELGKPSLARDLFDFIDADGNGTVDAAEISAFLGTEDEDIQKILDAHGGVGLTFEQLRDLLNEGHSLRCTDPNPDPPYRR